MIDTLRLSKRLQAAHMPSEQADALADGLAESLKESYVTREFLDSRLAPIKGDVNLLKWMASVILALQLAEFAMLWRLAAHG